MLAWKHILHHLTRNCFRNLGLRLTNQQIAKSPDMLATNAGFPIFLKTILCILQYLWGFFTCRSSLSSVLKWCFAWLTLFWVASLSSRTVLNRIWCSKSTVSFHWIVILPLLKGLAITGWEGEDSQWPKT